MHFNSSSRLAIDEPADDRDLEALAGKNVACGRALNASLGQAAGDAFDDVAALAQFAQRRLGGLIHGPLAGPDLEGEPEALQMPQWPDLEAMVLIGLVTDDGGQVVDAVPIGIASQLPIELRPAFGRDLALKRVTDTEIAAQPQSLRDQVLGAAPRPRRILGGGFPEIIGRPEPSRR